MQIPKFTLGQNILICLLFCVIQIVIIQNAQIIYIPEFFTLLFSMAYGILEPKRGWILSIIQVCVLIGAYWLLLAFGIKGSNPDITFFATHICIFPSFVAAFISSFIYKL